MTTPLPPELPMRDRVQSYIYTLQQQIVSALEAVPNPTAPLKFIRRGWSREESGGGVSFTTPATPVAGDDKQRGWLEKGTVNASVIYGILSPPAVRQMSTEHAELKDKVLADENYSFFAAGLSIILHPRNPNIPSIHANYRYMEVVTPDLPSSSRTSIDSDTAPQRLGREILSWWFGAVTDLTPSYLTPSQFRHFHSTLKCTLDAHSPVLYPVFKKSCDDYFYIPHRDERRGIGGIRFDNLNDKPHPCLPGDGRHERRPRTKEELFTLLKDLGHAFLPSYLPILTDPALSPSASAGVSLSAVATHWTEREKRWQLLRRGRSIEFTLIYERGTKFGLSAKGVNVENVLASMPEAARWEYMSDLGSDWEEEGEGLSEEGRMVKLLRGPPREWASD